MKTFLVVAVVILVVFFGIRAIMENRSVKKVGVDGVEFYPAEKKPVPVPTEPDVSVVVEKGGFAAKQSSSPDQSPSGKCECGSPIMAFNPEKLVAEVGKRVTFTWDGSTKVS